jgi:hypothetical protein
MSSRSRRLPIASTFLGTVAILAAAVSADQSRAASDVAAKPAQIRYEGTVWYEGHYRKPHDVRTYHSEAIYTADGHGRARVDWTTWSDTDSTRTPEAFLVLGDSVFHRNKPTDAWQLLAGERRRLGRLQTVAGIPSELGRLARSQPKPAGSDFMFDGPRFVYTERQAHPRLGDVIDSVVYSFEGNESLPREALLVVHERDGQFRFVEHRIGERSSVFPESLLQSPISFEPSPADEDSLVGEPKIVAIAPGLWSLDMEDIDSRSMIAEFANYLAVMEIAVGSANGERIVDAARRRWPNKPIRYALFSHHHPHYLGGIRAMIAEGATVVTTPGNEAFIREIATLGFESKPDRLALKPRPVKIKTFADRFEIADSTNQLVALNYGERSLHTDEFVVFWFPRTKVLFEAELGWVGVNGKNRPSSRGTRLLPWLDEQKIDVDRIVQSWPMKDSAASMTRADLEALIKTSKSSAKR